MPTNHTAFLSELRSSRIEAYRAMSSDIREHYNLEGEIAQNYRGRFVYELLQNADDAMALGGMDDRVLVRLDADALTVGNTGRPISEDDVRSLCGVSISTKAAVGHKRASIGHKGMGFKSVLEITDCPAVYSTGLSFRFDRRRSAEHLAREFGDGLVPDPARVPVMRLPFEIEAVPDNVERLVARGYHTVFHFPFHKPGMAERVGRILSRMDGRAILFLRHLEQVTLQRPDHDPPEAHWIVSRTVEADDGVWKPVGDLPGEGIARVTVADGSGQREYVLFSRDDIHIGDHRQDLDGASWQDVDLTEVALAIPVDPEDGGLRPHTDDPRIHVFLATGERCPYPFLVNGAFNCDLSRQSIRCTDDRHNYNGYLVRRVAEVFRDQVIPFARQQHLPTARILALLDQSAVRDETGETCRPDTTLSRTLRAAMIDALRDVPFLPTGGPELGKVSTVSSGD